MSKEKPAILADHNKGLSGGVFSKHVRELERLNKAESDLRNKKKLLKEQAEDDGIVYKEMVEAVKLSKRDPAELLAEHNTRVSYLRFLRAEYGDQLSFIEEKVDAGENLTEEQRNKHWRNEGYRAGLAAENRDKNPHDPNSEAGRQWNEGYEEGQGKNLEGITDGKGNKAKADPKVVPIGRRKPSTKATDPGPATEPATIPVGEDETPPSAPKTKPVSDDEFDSGGKLQA